MACGQGGYQSVLSQYQCSAMTSEIPSCLSEIQQCYSDSSIASCRQATNQCNGAQYSPLAQTGLNVYDLRTQCEGDLCYSGLYSVATYLNQPNVKAAIGANSNVNFQNCNDDINRAFSNGGDYIQSFAPNVAQILEAGVPVLIYAGDKDFICNWLGNQAWTKNLQWPGQAGFKSAPTNQWIAGGTHAGDVTNYQNLTFLRFFNAGHMVPHDKPAESLDMVNQWISGDYSLQGKKAGF